MVSVIIPCYNSQEYVGRAIQSMFDQSYKDWEIILVDNNSTDSTFSILNKYATDFPNQIYAYKEESKGSNFARNLGLRYAKGEYLQFLDADDELLPFKLQNQISQINSSNADVVLGSYLRKKEKLSPPIIVNEKKDFWKSFASSSLGITSANLYKKSAVLKVNGWNEGLSSSQEYDLLFRLIKAKSITVMDEIPSAIIHEVPNSITRTVNPARTVAVINDYISLRTSLKEYLAENNIMSHELNSYIDKMIYKALVGRKSQNPLFIEERIKNLQLEVPLFYKLIVRVNSLIKKKRS